MQGRSHRFDPDMLHSKSGLTMQTARSTLTPCGARFQINTTENGEPFTRLSVITAHRYSGYQSICSTSRATAAWHAQATHSNTKSKFHALSAEKTSRSLRVEKTRANLAFTFVVERAKTGRNTTTASKPSTRAITTTQRVLGITANEPYERKERDVKDVITTKLSRCSTCITSTEIEATTK